MKIYFIRHGETTGDIENRYGGTYDDHLSEKGVEQVQNLAAALKDSSIEILYVSPLLRAQETAKILSKSLHCDIQIVDDLRERNQYSFLSGMQKEEAAAKYPKEVEMLKDKLNTIDGAETYEDFSRRIAASFAALMGESKYNVTAIVSHGGPLRVLFRDILKWGELTSIGDCAYVELEKEGDAFALISSENITFSFKTEDLPKLQAL